MVGLPPELHFNKLQVFVVHTMGSGSEAFDNKKCFVNYTLIENIVVEITFDFISLSCFENSSDLRKTICVHYYTTIKFTIYTLVFCFLVLLQLSRSIIMFVPSLHKISCWISRMDDLVPDAGGYCLIAAPFYH